MMQEKVAPFFVSYCQGRLLECDALTEEAQVVAQLRRLREFVPAVG
jgi:thioredoxin 1